jgi:hypothetical protein
MSTEETILRLRLDTAAQSQVSRALGQTKTDIKAINSELGKLGSVAKAGVTSVRVGFDDLENQVDSTRASIEDLRAEIVSLDGLTVSPKIKTSRDGNALGTAGNASGDLGSAVSALGSLTGVSALGDVAGLGDLVEAVSRLPEAAGAAAAALGVSTGGLLAVLGVGAVAFAAVALAADNFFKTIDTGKKSLESGLDALEQYYDAQRDLTSEEARQKVEDLNRQRELDQQQRAQLEAVRASAFAQLQATLGDAGARLAVASGNSPITQLDERIKELDESIASTEQTVGLLNSGLEQGAFAFNDAALAAEEFAEKQAESAEQTRQFIAELKPEVYHASRDALDQLREAAAGVTDAAGEAASKLYGLGRDVVSSLLPDTRGLEAGAEKFLESVEETRQAAVKLAETTRNNLARAISGLGENVADTAADIASARQEISSLQSESDARIGDIRSQLRETEAEIQREGQEQLKELTTDHNVDRLIAEEDFEIALKAIKRRYRADSLNAEGERDALAALRAEDAKRDSTRAEKQQYSLEDRRRKEAYQRAIVDLAAKTVRETEVAQAGAQREIQVEQQKTSAEIQLRQQGLDIMLQQLAALASQATGANINSQNLVVPTSQTISNEEAFRLLHINGYAGGGVASGLARVNDGTGVESMYQRNKLVMLSEPTRIFSAEQTAAMMGGKGGFNPTFNIIGAGQNKKQVRETVDQRLDQYLTAVGWE